MTYQTDQHEGDLAHRCGGCGSRNMATTEKMGTTYATCADCGRFQELETRDWPMSKMCDNCAFRKDSPERADPDAWFSLQMTCIEREQPFYCHKGLAATLDGTNVKFAEPPEGQRHVCAGWMAMLKRKYDRAEKAAGRLLDGVQHDGRPQ